MTLKQYENLKSSLQGVDVIDTCMSLLCCTMYYREEPDPTDLVEVVTESEILTIAARRQEIIKMTEQLIESINTGDFEAYT